MPLYIEDDETARLVGQLAAKLKTTRQEAVRRAVSEQLARLLRPEEGFDAKLEAFFQRHPSPRPTGRPADKALFDDLSGEFD